MPSPQPLSGPSFHDPSNTGPRATHNLPTGGLFSIYASTPISAPPSAIYAAILDISSWKKWNTFVSDATITSHPHSHHKDLKLMPGVNMTLHLRITDTDTMISRETCEHVGELRTRKDYGERAVTRIRWTLHNATAMMPGFVLKVERVNEIEEQEDGTTLYRTWVSFGGWYASKLKKKYEGALRERFAEWCRDLKKYVEEGQEGGKGVNGG